MCKNSTDMLYTRVSACNVWWQSATAHGGRQKSSDFVCVFLSHLNLGLRCAQCVSHIVVVAVHLLVDFMFFFSDFKFGMQLGFAKGHHKITPRGKSGHGSGLGELPKIWGCPLIFLQRLKLATSNLVCGLGLPTTIIKSHPE